MRTGDFVVHHYYAEQSVELEAENWRLWSVPTCFVKEHRSSAKQPATCPFPLYRFILLETSAAGLPGNYL